MFTEDPSVFRREPSKDEVAAANTEIEQQEKTISKLDKMIHGLMVEISKLRVAQRTHHEVICRCKGVITLARRIPEEVLANIFEHCVADGWTRAALANMWKLDSLLREIIRHHGTALGT